MAETTVDPGDTAVAPAVLRGLVAACLAASLMPLNSTMIAVAVSDIARAMHEDAGTVTQALVATYLVAAIALQSPGGKIGDRIGQWRAFGFGQALLAAGAVAGFVAPDLVVLTASRVVMAAGGAIVVPATIALLRSELPESRRGRAFGIFGSVMSLAAGIGPLVGGELVRLWGWQAIFLANLPVIAASAALAATARRPRTPTRPTRFDTAGSLLLVAALTALVSGAEARGALAAGLLAAGVLALLPFVLVERRAADPVISFALFRNRGFAAGTVLVALLNLVMYALLFEIPLVLHVRLGLTAESAGRTLVFLMLAMVVASTIAGRLTDRYGVAPLALLGTSVCLVGVLLMLPGDLASRGELRLPLLVLGVGIGLATPAAQTASLSGVRREDSGMAAGVGSTMRYLGGIVGVAVLGRVIDIDRPAGVLLHQHHALLTGFAGVVVLALGCAALLARRSR